MNKLSGIFQTALTGQFCRSSQLVVRFCIGLPFALIALSGCSPPSLEKYSDAVVIPKEKIEYIESFDPLTFTKEKDSDTTLSDPESSSPTPKPPKEISLSIEQCRASALENNLDLKAQLYDPLLAGELVSESAFSFEPLVFSNFDFIKTDTPTSRSLDASQRKFLNTTTGLIIPLITGGSVTISQPLNRVETDNIFSTLNPSYETDLRVSLDQPLLRGGGVQRSLYGIRIAQYDSQMSQARTKLQIIGVITAVDQVYWRLYAARRGLLVRKEEYDLAGAQLERAKRKVQAGDSRPIEIIRAEAAIAARLENIIIAQNMVSDRQRDLKRILNKPGLEMETATVVIPSVEPNPVHYQLETKKIVQYALENRMELLELELQIAKDVGTVDFMKNGTLPFLSLRYAYHLNGLGGSAGDAYEVLGDNRFADHQLGLQFQLPLGNGAAQSRLRQAVLTRLKSLASKRRRQAEITQDVLNAVDQVEANWQRILASRQNALLAERTLSAEQRQFELGLQISTEVLDAQAKYADAKLNEVDALVEYQMALVDLGYKTGSLLGAARIHWDTESNELSMQ